MSDIDLLKLFLNKAKENLDDMEENLVRLESNPDGDVLDAVFRTAHKIKGDAMVMEFHEMAATAHIAEDLLDKLRSKKVAVSDRLISVLLGFLDVLRDQLASLAGETPDPHGPEKERKGDRSVHSDNKSIRVDTDKLDKLISLTGEITIHRERIRRLLLDQGKDASNVLLETFREADRFYSDLQEIVMKSRMVSIGPVFHQQTRLVRDLSKSLRKSVELSIEGESVEVDTMVVDNLRDPLTHMIRNALDHGMELPDVRLKNGKTPTGRLTLRAFHAAGQVVLQVEDDGAGLNRDHILATARRKGLVPEGRTLTDDEVYQLIFEPGFSTAQQVTEISGRGMGMDIVRKNIQALRGNVTVQSRPGLGATITIRLPLTMAVIQGLYVESAGETYILPLESVLECLNFPKHERAKTTHVINLRGQPLPYIRLRDIFHAGSPAPDRENVVVIHHDGGSAGIAVDALKGQGQTVIKPLDKLFEEVPCVSGSAVTGEGRVALILDVVGLVHRAQQLRVADPPPPTPPEEGPPP